MSAENDIVVRARKDAARYHPHATGLIRDLAAEIVRLRREVESLTYRLDTANAYGDQCDVDIRSLLPPIAPAEAKGLAPAMPNGVEADWNCIISVLEHGMRDGIHGGYNASYIKQQIAALRAADNRDAAGVDGEGWPPCPQCKAGILYECPACSSTNYPRDAIAPQPAAGEAVADVVLHDGLLYGRLRGDLPVGTKLYTAPAAVPAGEAVAWLASDGEVFTDKESADRHSKVWGVNPLLTPLYTTPPAPVQDAPQEGIEARARSMFEEANKDANSAPWDRQWEPTKAYWRDKAAHPSACELGAVRVDDPGEFGVGIQPNPKARYWQERADFWRGQTLLLGYDPEVAANVDAALQHRGDSRGGEG